MNKDKLNKEMSELLIQLREESGLSQQEIAVRSNVFGIGPVLDQRSASRVEKSPLTSDATKLAAYLIAVGRKPEFFYDTLRAKVSIPQLATLNSDNSENNMKIKTMLEASLLKLNEISSIVRSETNNNALDLSSLLETIDQAGTALNCLNRKPIIAAFGLFDAAKSTYLNTVSGQSSLPEKYQPATSVVNLLIHIDDKPSTINGKVAVFRKGFQPFMIHDAELVNKYMITEGDESILNKFGVHNYDSEDQVTKEAYMSISFLDSDILKDVWLLDTPGDLNSSDVADTDKALAGAELADGVIYLSSFNGYMNGNDLGFLANIIRNKPPVAGADPLGHIMFTLSHCHDGISVENFEQIKNTTFSRCKKQMDNLVFDQWKENGDIENLPTAAELSARVRPFYRENQSYVSQTLESVSTMAQELQKNHEKLVEQRITSIESGIAAKLETEMAKVISFKANTEDRIKEVNDMDARFRAQSGELVAKFKALINNCGKRAVDDKQTVSDYYKSLMQQSSLSELISETFSDKKEASEGIGNYLTQLLTGRLEKTMVASGKDIANETELLLREWQEIVPNHTALNASEQDVKVDCDIDLSAFNARAAFIGGLSGLGSLGAMSLYVSTIASNLGAYILVGKAAGVLTSLGLASGVTSVTSLVAAMGGPITIGIAIAASIGYIVYRLVGGSWQDTLAKKVIEALEDNDVEHQLHAEITRFWENTKDAMTVGLAELEAATDEFIIKMKEEAQTEFTPESLEATIEIIKRAQAQLA
ncbi:Dynamin N-terminal domain-containing protein [Vibrio crassostreae]|nr:conserved membrane hypothetical protein [Vibrio chagasii]CAK2848648.1 Dynamin N-terminal domain-containing protein [Vibrio crassostreae]